MSEQRDPEGVGEERGEAPPAARRPPAVRRQRRPHRRQATVGGVIGRSFGIWVRNFVPFLALTVLVFSPYIALQYWLGTQPLEVSASLPAMLGVMAAQWLLGYIVTGALIQGVFAQLRGRRAAMGEILGRGAARVPALIGVGVVVAVCTYLPMLPGGVALAFESTRGLSALLLIAGFIPVIVITCGLFIAIPVSVVERPGVFGAVRRSWELSRGSKGTIFVILLLYGIAATILSLVAVALVGLALGESVLWAQVTITLLTTSVNAVFAAVAYHDIRVGKEGIGTEELAAIFD